MANSQPRKIRREPSRIRKAEALMKLKPVGRKRSQV